MQAPWWKTGYQHMAISSTSGCSVRGNELNNSLSSSKAVGFSIGRKNWLVNTFSLLFMGPEGCWEMSLFYVEHSPEDTKIVMQDGIGLPGRSCMVG